MDESRVRYKRLRLGARPTVNASITDTLDGLSRIICDPRATVR